MTRRSIIVRVGEGGGRTSSLTRRWPSRSWKPFGLESVLGFEHSAEPKPGCRDLCYCLSPDRIWLKVNDPKVDYIGGWGKERSGSSQDSNHAWLCWSSSPTRKWPSWTRKLYGLESILDFEHSDEPKPDFRVHIWLLPVCLYSISRCHSAGRGKYFSTQEVPS